MDTSKARFDTPLVRVSRQLAAGRPIKIVALGSSSTYGAGASSRAASYPSRLADELALRLPGHEITVVNRGVGGDEAADMLARLDRDVVAEKPDLVLWQVGTNSLLRDKAVLPHATLLYEGLKRLKAIGADVVLIDPQFAPKVLAKSDHEGMVSLISTAAKAEHVCLFNRFALMRQWHEGDHLPFEIVPVLGRAAHERLELRLRGQVARGGDRRGGHPSDRDSGGPAERTLTSGLLALRRLQGRSSGPRSDRRDSPARISAAPIRRDAGRRAATG